MKKQIILSPEEYESLCEIASIGVIITDKYVQKEMNKGPGHPMDRETVDKVQHELFVKILNMEDSIKNDVESYLPKNYFENLKIESVWSESEMF